MGFQPITFKFTHFTHYEQFRDSRQHMSLDYIRKLENPEETLIHRQNTDRSLLLQKFLKEKKQQTKLVFLRGTAAHSPLIIHNDTAFKSIFVFFPLFVFILIYYNYVKHFSQLVVLNVLTKLITWLTSAF